MFCSECGKEIAEGSKFCPECGKAIALPETDSAPSEREAESKLPAEDVQQLEYCFIGSAVCCGVAAVLAMAAKSTIFFLVDGSLGVLIYMLCYQRLQDGDYATAKTASLGIGVACGVLGLLAVVANDFSGLMGLGACGALIYAFSKL